MHQRKKFNIGALLWLIVNVTVLIVLALADLADVVESKSGHAESATECSPLFI